MRAGVEERGRERLPDSAMCPGSTGRASRLPRRDRGVRAGRAGMRRAGSRGRSPRRPAATRLGPACGAACDLDRRMAAMGSNPARIIPALHVFCARYQGPSESDTSVSRPGPAGPLQNSRKRHGHEALLNLAFADTEISIFCPYSTLLAGVSDRRGPQHPPDDAPRRGRIRPRGLSGACRVPGETRQTVESPCCR